ncbi:MAG TPA: DUF99 family protein [Candidatus Methanoperedenaceae archaeon]|nr:DUF99 family protein [Candidatus Methanoperedenaceae archaeon]
MGTDGRGNPCKKFHIKPEIRVLGIDDSAILDERVLLVGCVFRGGEWLDGVLSAYVSRDGLEATEVIIGMIKGTKHFGQVRLLMLDGITYAGFNTVDVASLYQKTGLPIIVVMRAYPDFGSIRAALRHLDRADERWDMIRAAGEIKPVTTREPDNPVFIQYIGICIEEAGEVVRMTSTRSNIPEPLRVAHLIAGGIVLGESSGKA